MLGSVRIPDTEKAIKFGLTAVSMKDIGKMTKPTEEAG